LEASNADDAITALKACEDIHLVFTDIDMPGSMDGLCLAAFVRDRWPTVEIIVTNGKHRPSALPKRAVFIPKPYPPPHVAETIRALAG
jgi:CheY-like chemotaxis protein